MPIPLRPPTAASTSGVPTRVATRAPVAPALVLSAATLLALGALATPARALSPPDPSGNIPWDEDPERPEAQADFEGVAAVEAAFDNARRAEERQLDLPDGALGTLELPDQDAWDAMDGGARALALANAERTARAGVPYPGGAPLGLPLEAVETHLDALAQAYADYMLAENYWGHDAPADGAAPFAGSDPFSRIDAHPALGEGAGADGGDCHDFLGQAENLAVFASSGGDDIRLPVERAIYGFVYDDAGSAWGHRHLMLLQDRPLRRDSGGFVDDAGPAGSEGYLGVGSAGANDGSYRVFDDAEGFPVQRNVVVLIIDPVPGDGCGYELEEAPPGG